MIKSWISEQYEESEGDILPLDQILDYLTARFEKQNMRNRWATPDIILIILEVIPKAQIERSSPQSPSEYPLFNNQIYC